MSSKTIYSNRYNRKQTHDSLIANWIAVFEYSKAHQSIQPLSLENFKMATHIRNRPIMHCKPSSIEYVMYVYGLCLLFYFVTKNLHLATIFYHLVAKWHLNNFFSSATNSNWFRESYLFKFCFIIICEERKQKVLILN